MADPITMNLHQKSVGHVNGFLTADVPPKPATVEADAITGAMIAWESDNPSVLAMIASADGMDVEATPVDNSMAPGDPAITVNVVGRADANKDPNVRNEITFSQVFVLTADAVPEAVAASFDMVFSSPVSK